MNISLTGNNGGPDKISKKDNSADDDQATIKASNVRRVKVRSRCRVFQFCCFLDALPVVFKNRKRYFFEIA